MNEIYFSTASCPVPFYESSLPVTAPLAKEDPHWAFWDEHNKSKGDTFIKAYERFYKCHFSRVRENNKVIGVSLTFDDPRKFTWFILKFGDMHGGRAF